MTAVGNIAVVFPGQGAQRRGMLSAYAGVTAVAKAVAEVSAAIGEDLAAIIEEDGDALNQTINTQPAMLALGVGVYRAAAAHLPLPRCFAGHSLGEYSALVCAGALSLTTAARLVHRRAWLMQHVAAHGGMAAVLGADAAMVEATCSTLRRQGEDVWPANYNSETQIVIAGRRLSVAKGVEALKAAGAKRAVLLPMSVPSHCPLMAAAADGLMPMLNAVDWQPPTAPVLHSAADSGASPAARLAAQLTTPIHWQRLLAEAAALGAQTVVESGPGKVLTGLGKKSGLPHIALDNSAALMTLAR